MIMLGFVSTEDFIIQYPLGNGSNRSALLDPSPNEGDNLVEGTGASYVIDRRKIGLVGTIEIQHTIDNGVIWSLTQSVGGVGAGAVDPNDEQFEWDVDPANDMNLPGTGAYVNSFIRTRKTSGAIPDRSDAPFTMTVP